MTNTPQTIDQAIIILSFIYQTDKEVFQKIMSSITLSESKKQQIIKHIDSHSFYDTDLINQTLEQFCEDMNNTTVVSYDALSKIKLLLHKEPFLQNIQSYTDISPLDSCDTSTLVNYLKKSNSDIKGLVCNSLSDHKFKDVLLQITPEDLPKYLESFHDISPVNSTYLTNFAHFLLNKLSKKSVVDTKALQYKLHKLVAVVESMNINERQAIFRANIHVKLFQIIKPYCLACEDIMAFNANDQKQIMDTLHEKRMLAQFLSSLRDTDRRKLTIQLSDRQQSIVEEELSFYKTSPNEINIDDVERATIQHIRKLQQKKQIDETVKNIIAVDTKTLEINMLNTKTLQDGLQLTQENKELAE